MAAHEHAHAHRHDHDADDRHEPESPAEKEREAEKEATRQLALAQIRQYPDPALRLKAYEVESFDEDLRRLVRRMTNLMHGAQGVGLAATQVGLLQRLFVFEPDDDGPRAVVNPTLLESSAEPESDEEGCLSLQGVRVPVERSVRVVLAGKDEKGKDVRLNLTGHSARIAQHELDHLDGVLIIDRTDDEHRKQALAVLRPRVVLR
jgi:peptide deformylase